MSEPQETYDPPQDTGAPDAVETDPVALNSAEDLDEDRLRQDPLEAGMDPPEHWSGVDKYGMTPWEQSHPRPMADRLAEEQPDLTAAASAPAQQDPDDAGEPLTRRDAEDLGPGSYEQELGIAADIPGGSVPRQIQEPPEPD